MNVLQFEPEHDLLKVSGSASSYFQGILTPTNIIDSNEDWRLSVSVELGELPKDLAAHKIAVTFYIESLALGDYILEDLPLKSEATWEQGKRRYDFQVEIKSQRIPPGVYSIAAAATLTDKEGKSLPFSGYADLGIIQVYSL